MPVTEEDVEAELRATLPAEAVDDALWSQLTFEIGAYLADGAQVRSQLEALEIDMLTLAEGSAHESELSKVGGVLGERGASVFLPLELVSKTPKIGKILTLALAKRERDNGFALGTKVGEDLATVPALLTGILTPKIFRGRLLAKGRPFKDPGAGPAHGEFTHRIQWYCVMGRFAGRLPPGKRWVDYYKWVGQQISRINPDLGLWDALFDRLPAFGNAPVPLGAYMAANNRDFRSPELLWTNLTNLALLQGQQGFLDTRNWTVFFLGYFLLQKSSKRFHQDFSSESPELSQYILKHVAGPGRVEAELSKKEKKRLRLAKENGYLRPLHRYGPTTE